MCLILFSYKTHPDYKLVLAANRDEFYERPTEAAGWWQGSPELLGGRDIQAGGTWLAITKTGKFAAITNYRDLSNIKPDAPTRGKLITDYLTGDLAISEYLDQIDQRRDEYNGYNLLIGTIDDLWYYTNMAKKAVKLEPGIYGLSNELLDSPWPKVELGKEKIKKLISKKDFRPASYFTALNDYDIADDTKLPSTGVPLEWERALSPMFIEMEEYGTRCSTFVSVDSNDQVYFEERGYVPRSSNKFEFKKK